LQRAFATVVRNKPTHWESLTQKILRPQPAAFCHLVLCNYKASTCQELRLNERPHLMGSSCFA